ncbi:unnamed protein product [Cyprideis torosa]|uniref:Uncharacterized protein n=1 Tax=Cyprideis torosa TaxID=163714 RepID=A0A7R8W721_9CRUS|nr:unnamed protein product [Cyprideis torosa]CAG0887073.1 unnamed protein product [Cyprideis torosa]
MPTPRSLISFVVVLVCIVLTGLLLDFLLVRYRTMKRIEESQQFMSMLDDAERDLAGLVEQHGKSKGLIQLLDKLIETERVTSVRENVIADSMALFSNSDEFRRCPFDLEHYVPGRNYYSHVQACRLKNPDSPLIECPFRGDHFSLPEEMRSHIRYRCEVSAQYLMMPTFFIEAHDYEKMPAYDEDSLNKHVRFESDVFSFANFTEKYFRGSSADNLSQLTGYGWVLLTHKTFVDLKRVLGKMDSFLIRVPLDSETGYPVGFPQLKVDAPVTKTMQIKNQEIQRTSEDYMSWSMRFDCFLKALSSFMGKSSRKRSRAEEPVKTPDASKTQPTKTADDDEEAAYESPLSMIKTSASQEATVEGSKRRKKGEESSEQPRKKSKSSGGDIFVIDTGKGGQDGTAPIYRQGDDEDNEEGNEQKSDKKKPSMGVAVGCFNCGEDHNMTRCPHPKDPQAIMMNRAMFMQRQRARYHLSAECKASVVPGVISSRLRSALQIRSSEVPEFVYRMRLWGYPPGWLEEAKEEHSGITLYDAEGEEVSNAHANKNNEYDFNKIIEFPGFNVEMPGGERDEHNRYGVPPLSDHNLKRNWTNFIKKSDAALPKRSAPPRTSNIVITLDEEDSDSDIQEVDMGKQEVKADEEEGEIGSSDDDKKKKSERKQKKEKSKPPSTVEETPPKSPSAPPVVDVSGEDKEKEPPVTPSVSKVKDVSLGTPILPSVSPYNRLPDYDKFSQGITEHIPFENLPDSTGTYQKISGIIMKVRQKMKQIH